MSNPDVALEQGFVFTMDCFSFNNIEEPLEGDVEGVIRESGREINGTFEVEEDHE